MTLDPKIRKTVLAVLTTIFFMQGWLVYTDETGRQGGPLSAPAKHGQDIWRRNNCQACHQLYGLGGFSGPDLTKMADRRSFETFNAILKNIAPPMPRFSMNPEEAKDLYTYLHEIADGGLTPRRAPSQIQGATDFAFSDIPWFAEL